jgi:signal transduction histidine kinase
LERMLESSCGSDRADGLERIARGVCELVCEASWLDVAAFALFPRAGGSAASLLAYSGVDPDEARELVFSPASRGVTAQALRDGYHESADGPVVAVSAATGEMRALLVGRRAQSPSARDACIAQVLESTMRLAAISIGDHRAVVAEERARAARRRVDLVRVIHDDVVQRMFGVALALDVHEPIDPDVREVCAAEVERALFDLRRILRDEIDQGQGAARCRLLDILEELAAQGVAVQVSYDEPSLDAAQETIMVSVLAEAVRNARKHASPESIKLSVTEDDGLLVLAVTNDGVAGIGRARPTKGVGLKLAETEAAQGGGLLQYGMDGAARWTIRLVLPTRERDEFDVGCSDARGSGRRSAVGDSDRRRSRGGPLGLSAEALA